MARIFITGSADGLGQLAAKALIARGHHVVLHACNEKRGREALDKPLWQHAVLPFLKPHAVFTTNYDNRIEMSWRLQDVRDDIKPLKPLFKETSRLSDDFVHSISPTAL